MVVFTNSTTVVPNLGYSKGGKRLYSLQFNCEIVQLWNNLGKEAWSRWCGGGGPGVIAPVLQFCSLLTRQLHSGMSK